MDDQDIKSAPKDLGAQIEKMIRALPKDEQFTLYKELKSNAGDQRKSIRKDFSTEVVYMSERGGHHEFAKDISETGLFIETSTPLAIIGEKLSLTFTLKDISQHIKISGEIVRKTDTGIGIKFHPIDLDKQSLLKNLLESL